MLDCNSLKVYFDFALSYHKTLDKHLFSINTFIYIY